MAANWNILYFTTGYNDPVIHQKDITPTWISIEPFNRDALVHRTVDVLHFFNWTTIFIITTANTAAFCLDVRDEVVKLMAKTSNKFQYSQATIDLANSYSRGTWCQQLGLVSRIVLVLTLASQYRQVMIAAASCNLTNGDNVFLGHKYPDEHSNNSWAYGDPYDDIARSAFRAAVLLEDIPPSAEDMTEQDMPIDKLRMASRDQYNVSWTTPPLRLLPTYEAVMVLGSVVVTWRKHPVVSGELKVLRDGAALKQKIVDQRFLLKSGWVQFNEFGERVINASLLFFNHQTEDFELASINDAPANFSIQLQKPWFNQNSLPANEPPCGYQNQKCSSHADSTVMVAAVLSSVAAVLIAVIFLTFVGMRYRVMHADWWLLQSDELRGEPYDHKRGKAQVAA